MVPSVFLFLIQHLFLSSVFLSPTAFPYEIFAPFVVQYLPQSYSISSTNPYLASLSAAALVFPSTRADYVYAGLALSPVRATRLVENLRVTRTKAKRGKPTRVPNEQNGTDSRPHSGSLL